MNGNAIPAAATVTYVRAVSAECSERSQRSDLERPVLIGPNEIPGCRIADSYLIKYVPQEQNRYP